MRTIKVSGTIFAVSIFLIACNSNQPQQTATVDPNANNVTITQPVPDQNDYWAKDNLDLQRVGNLLERSKTPQEFERYLNSNNGINNLDLNGDGYADYISVREYQDRGTNERGLSLFSRFGPDLIQEIATIILYRDNLRSPGARILLTGNDQIYGDNNYYEANWMDRSLGIANALFGNRNTYYSSPYYYNNYPGDYRTYQVVDPSYYRTRVEQLYPQPVFVYTTNPSFIDRIKIKSPNNGLHLGQIKARLVKPTDDQAEFLKNNPGRPPFVRPDKDESGDRSDKGDRGGKKDDVSKPDDQPKDDRKAAGKDDKSSKPDKVEKQNGKPAKQDNDGKGGDKGQGKGGDKGQGKGKKP